jgi:hypothetical protein
LNSGFDDQDGGAGGGARFQGFVGLSGILERKSAIGSIGPEAPPNVTINPRGLRQSSERKKVSLPTESKTTGQKHKLTTLYNGEPTIPQVHYHHNDIAIYARF